MEEIEKKNGSIERVRNRERKKRNVFGSKVNFNDQEIFV